MIIDAKDLLLGRIASFAAKQALLGEEVTILNSESVVVSGTKKLVLGRYKEGRERGHPYAGPFMPTQPHMMLKRTIRGMVPWQQPRGREAMKRIKCYKGVPKEFESKDIQTVENAKAEKLPHFRYISLGEISKELK